MTTRYEKACEARDKGLLKEKKSGDYSLFCYTQDCFWGQDTWDETTESHRGALYYKGIPVNAPFKKIFNLGERPETSLEEISKRLNNEPYHIYDKANGHLFIVSCFIDDNDEQRIVMHTKAGFPGESNDLLNNDIELFLTYHSSQLMSLLKIFPCCTLMFEAIVEHDKHTMYDEQVEAYQAGKNFFVLLGMHIFTEEGEWINVDYPSLKDIAEFVLKAPVVIKYDSVEGTPDKWALHTDREGYVIHFLEDNFRVKIKTKEYWALRFKKDLSAERIIAMFRQAGFTRIHKKLPEEVAEKIINVLKLNYGIWYTDEYVKVGEIHEKWITEAIRMNLSGRDEQTMKEVFAAKDLTTEQKLYIAEYIKQDSSRGIEDYKTLRVKFENFINTNEEYKSRLQEDLESIVDTI